METGFISIDDTFEKFQKKYKDNPNFKSIEWQRFMWELYLVKMEICYIQNQLYTKLNENINKKCKDIEAQIRLQSEKQNLQYIIDIGLIENEEDYVMIKEIFINERQRLRNPLNRIFYWPLPEDIKELDEVQGIELIIKDSRDGSIIKLKIVEKVNMCEPFVPNYHKYSDYCITCVFP